MATLIKIRGLNRGIQPQEVATTARVTDDPATIRGFRVRSHLGRKYQSGVAASLSFGAPVNDSVTVTANYGGTYGNNIQFALTETAGTGLTVATTFAATTGFPLITVTVASGTGASTSGVVYAVNNDETASQYITASFGGSGGYVGAITATNLAGGLNTGVSATDAEPPYNVLGEPIWLRVTNRSTHVVDLEDTVNARILQRNKWRYDSLGQP